MKSIALYVTVILFAIQSIWAAPQSRTKKMNDPHIIRKAQQIRYLYKKAVDSSGNYKLYQHLFFNEFPSTFQEFNGLFGYQDSAAILYEEGQDHLVPLFSTLSTINDTIYYKKLISISLGGEWDADAVNIFQHNMREKICKNIGLTLYILNKMPIDKGKSFWFFYCDQIHPKKEVPVCLHPISRSNPAMYKIIVETQKKVIVKWGKSGHGD